MTWHGASDAPPSARIVSLAPSLQRTERRVAEFILTDRSGTVERTAQELADAVGVGRTTVIRAVQSLGYEGYPQLRVALAQELAMQQSSDAEVGSDGSMLGTLRARVARFGSELSHAMAAMTDESLLAFIETLDTAQRVLVVANGLSVPLGLDLMLRLNSAGRPTEQIVDAISQQISARQLGEGSACVAFSGSGANRATLDAMRAAKESGATVLTITSFARSAAAELADIALVVPPANESFRHELTHTSRAVHMLLTEQLIELFIEHRGDRARDARAASLSVLGSALQE
ncbi:MAG TPA: MurR/RpiR family transcriptional regulator [Candidatus Agrococcus pullicola]|uniref:MurR/RpiR family transcriptional regulator n=1 Tax=Candidatus Agrococcus pullicola TaxID=2838429 RepID=A0A9D1YWN7_9MICO|nr:MurR/RpiR family transcriptional regulator [Candidatus Agrococcus pullicola]